MIRAAFTPISKSTSLQDNPGQPAWYRYNSRSGLSVPHEYNNISAGLGWPVWIGFLSTWVVRMVRVNSIERCETRRRLRRKQASIALVFSASASRLTSKAPDSVPTRAAASRSAPTAKFMSSPARRRRDRGRKPRSARSAPIILASISKTSTSLPATARRFLTASELLPAE